MDLTAALIVLLLAIKLNGADLRKPTLPKKLPRASLNVHSPPVLLAGIVAFRAVIGIKRKRVGRYLHLVEEQYVFVRQLFGILQQQP